MSSDLLQIVQSCVQDAVDRLSWSCPVSDVQTLEGQFLVLTPAGASSPRAVIAAMAPNQSPYDDVVRDRLRSVAARMQIPWMVVTSIRTTLVYSTDAVTQRRPPYQMVPMQWKGASVHRAHQTLAAAPRVAYTESLRACFAWLRDTDPQTMPPDEGTLLRRRCMAMMDEMQACQQGPSVTVQLVEHLAAAALGYALAAALHPELLPPFHVPRGIRDERLLLDILQAYLAHGRRVGYDLPELPYAETGVELVDELRPLFTTTITDLLATIESIPFHTWDHEAVQSLLDGLSTWGGTRRGTVVPTAEMIELLIEAVQVPSAGPIIIREYGTSVGACSRWLAQHRSHVTAIIDPVAMAAEPFLRIQAALHTTTHDTHPPADVVVVSIEDSADAVRMTQALEHATRPESLATTGSCIVMLPQRALQYPEYDAVRAGLLRAGEVTWIFSSDAEPLTQPNGGYCFAVISKTRSGPTYAATFRVALSQLLHTVGNAQVLLRYLSAGKQGKLNAEVAVRFCDRDTVLDGDVFLPADVLLRVVAKLQAALVPLHTMGEVSSGLRTGASDVLIPDVRTIAEQGLEEVFWQRQLPNGETIDTVTLTSADDVDSPLGLPRSDRRLLLLPAQRAEFEHLRVGDHLQRAERDGVHTRPSVRHRSPWWYIEPPTIPSIVIPKEQRTRWLWAANRSRAHISDAFVGVMLFKPELTDRLVLWMNSTLGMFIHELLNVHHHVADVTVRDVHEFLVPPEHLLAAMDPRQFKDVAYRPVDTVAAELGTSIPEVVRPDTVARDRRRVDRFWMEEVLGLTIEEQTVIYRFVLHWRACPSSVRHLASAITTVLELQRSTEPVGSWYLRLLEGFGDEQLRHVTVPAHVTHADAVDSMFTPQTVCYQDAHVVVVLDCQSSDEAELMSQLINLGVRSVALPQDPREHSRLAREVSAYAVRYHQQLEQMLASVPESIRSQVAESIAGASHI